MSVGYTYDEADVKSGLVDEGDYEVILERMERKVIQKTGKNKLSLMFRIRKDVEQKFGNKCLFEDIWAEKEHPDIFNRKRINQLLGTQHPKNGTQFADINEVIKFLVGCPLIIRVTKVFDEYNDEEVNQIAFYQTSKIKPKTLGGSTPVASDSKDLDKKIEESKAEVGKFDDDVPF